MCGTAAAGRSFGGGYGGSSGVSGGGRGEEPSPQKRKQQEERWVVGAYVILRGSVDLYVLERCVRAL